MTYAIYSERGQELTTWGIQGYELAREQAQALADQMAETVYLDTVPSSTDPDEDEDFGLTWLIVPTTVRCECGATNCERCQWTQARP